MCWNRRFLFFAYIFMVPVVFILPLYSVKGYSIIKNTTSHLGAQNTPNAWVMNVIFVLLGAACILEGLHLLKRYRLQQFVIIIFGAGLILTAVFRHAPIHEGIPYSVPEDQLHSLFATVVGFSFTFFAVSAMFVVKTAVRRVAAFSAAFWATLMSVLFFQVPDYAGIWQRMMFLFTFAWLIYFFEGIRNDEQQPTFPDQGGGSPTLF